MQNQALSQNKILTTIQHVYNFQIEDIVQNEIFQRIQQTQTQYSISQGQAVYILSQAQWDKNIKKYSVGAMIDILYPDVPESIEQQANNKECFVCFEELNEENQYSLKCKHNFCKPCFKNYLEVAHQESGQEVIFKQCPLEDCSEKVDMKAFETLLGQEMLDKYKQYVIQDVFISSPNYLPCPATECNQICVTKSDDLNIKNSQLNIKCKCNKFFCNLCKEDSHRPLSCEKLVEWRTLLGGADTDNTLSWIKRNSKLCPKCKVHIEKNQGCNHMTCRKCGHEFCWLCLQNYRQHQNCSQFQENRGNDTNAEKKKKKFDFYQEKYLNYKVSVVHTQIARDSLKEKIKVFEQSLNFDTPDFQLFYDGFNLILEVRKAIQYSFPIAYFIEDENDKNLLQSQQNQMMEKLEEFDKMLSLDLNSRFFDANNFSKLQNEEVQKKQFVQNYQKFKQEVIDKSAELEIFCNNMLVSFQEKLPQFSVTVSKINENEKLVKNRSKIFQQQLDKQNSQMKIQNSVSKQYSVNFNQNVIVTCVECEVKQATNDLDMCDDCYKSFYEE